MWLHKAVQPTMKTADLVAVEQARTAMATVVAAADTPVVVEARGAVPLQAMAVGLGPTTMAQIPPIPQTTIPAQAV